MGLRLAAIAAALLATAAPMALANDYLQAGVDSGRTGWIKDEAQLTKTSAPSLKLRWSVKLPVVARQMHSLFPPLVAGAVSTPAGQKEIVMVSDVSNHIWGLDAATGQILWSVTFDTPTYAGGEDLGGFLCPGGTTAIPVLGKGATPGSYNLYALDWSGRLHTIDVATGREPAPAQNFTMPNGKPYALNLFNNVIYTVNAQNCGGNPNGIVSFDLATRRASIMLPRGGGLWGRQGVAIGSDGTAYMGTGDNPYFGERGILGNSIVAAKLDANDTLQLTGWFAPWNANWMFKRDQDMNVSPLAIDHKGRHFLFGTSKECRVWMLDRDAFGGADHRTTLDTSNLICNDRTYYDLGVWGAMSAGEDASGTLWLYVPFWGPESVEMKAALPSGPHPENGGVAAFKVQQVAGRWKLVPAWVSADMNRAETSLLVNGMVVTYGSGEDTYQKQPEQAWDEPRRSAAIAGITNASQRRIYQSTHATLFVLDAATGRSLWDSGETIRSFSHFSGIAEANGRIYVPTFDGTLYAFGVDR